MVGFRAAILQPGLAAQFDVAAGGTGSRSSILQFHLSFEMHMAFSGRGRCDLNVGLLKVVEVQGVLQVACQFIKTILHAIMCAYDMQWRYAYTEESPMQEILFA